MFHATQRRQGMTSAIFGMWRNWIICVGTMAMLCFVAPLLGRVWSAPLCLLGFLFLRVVQRVLGNGDIPNCSRLFSVSEVVLMIMTVGLAAAYLIVQRGPSYEITGQPFTEHVPFLPILVTAPVTAIVSFCFLAQKKEPRVCQLCHLRYGNVVEHGFVGDLYRREWRYQTKLLGIACVLLGVVDWSYYIIHYVNVNLNRADYFFFLWMPILFYFVSVIYLGIKYYSLWIYYCHNDEGHLIEKPSSTTVRFMVICRDRVLLDMCQTDLHFDNGQIIKRFDTPASYVLPYVDSFSEQQARSMFAEKTGIDNAEVREMFSSPDRVTYRNIFHFFAFIDDFEEIAESRLQGVWLSLGQLRQLIEQRLMGRDMSGELSRIYHVAMAWKTYDREGNRLYKIKHYRPTFRLKDIRNWDVDYDDEEWLKIGAFNADSPLFRFRKIFNRIGEWISRKSRNDNLASL